jgi:hypothetical protein
MTDKKQPVEDQEWILAHLHQPQTEAELMASMDKAIKSGDYKAVAKVASEIAKVQKVQEATELKAKEAAMAGLQDKVKAAIEKAIKPMVDAKELDKADGIWYVYDFGEKATSCQLMKKTAKARATTSGGGGGKKFDLDTKPGSDIFNQYASQPYKETGMTLQQAWDSNVDKNWRFGIRQFLLKKANIIS